MSTLGQRIRQRREELGLTQSELASRLGYKSKVSVSNAENDRDDMTTTRISKYADALETTEAYLMGWDPPDDYYIQTYEGELFRTRVECYGARDFWAYHILEIGDAIPQEGIDDLVLLADVLAKKYNVQTITKDELDKHLGGHL